MTSVAAKSVLNGWASHPCVARLSRYLALSASDIASLGALIDQDVTVEKRRDLVVDGDVYRKLAFVGEGFDIPGAPPPRTRRRTFFLGRLARMALRRQSVAKPRI
jgi:hypothetical protein